MTTWQYQLRYTNLNWGDGGAKWTDVTDTEFKAIDLTAHAHLRFRKKPRRLRLRLRAR
jgi:hypothetical protein